MSRVITRAGLLLALLIGTSAAEVAAQDRVPAAPARHPRLSVEGGAGVQLGYGRGNTASAGVGFSPNRNITFLVIAEREHVPFRRTDFANGYSVERGGQSQFVSLEVRYAFLPGARISPYGIFGTGRGRESLTVNSYYPEPIERNIGVVYYGAGARMPIHRRLDAFVDAKFMVTAGREADASAMFMPIRAGVAWRF